MRCLVFVVLAALLGLTIAANYNGFKVYKIEPKTEEDNNFLLELSSHPNFDFWSKINRVGNAVTVMVAPETQRLFEIQLKIRAISHNIIIENVEKTIQLERESFNNQAGSGRINMTFDKYYRHDDINNYLNQLVEEYPELVSIENVGVSYEKREMKVIRISSGARDPPKPVIFVDGGIHAREWIAPAAALYIINQLVENYAANAELLENVDWLVLPVANPDGYEYSATTNRMWRKNRSPGKSCFGCDLNRNFGFHWMDSGSSKIECIDIYAGKSAFSEAESQNLRDIVNKTDNVAAYLTFHSYGQYLLYPWGYENILCDNWKELNELGNAMNDAIRKVRGTKYTVGSSSLTLYPAAGGSDDWAKSIGVPVVYTMELPGGGPMGFDLPPRDILGVVQETLEGVKVLRKHVADYYA